MKATVVIPVYNGAARLHLPLGALAAQTVGGAAMEVVVVDNRSSDGTAEAAGRLFEATGLARRCACRVVREGQPGLTYARICGVSAAAGEVVCFLDDDNVPVPGYVATGLALFADERVGVLVSRVTARYDGFEPPPSVRRREAMLAVNDWLGPEPITWPAEARLVPTVGAGLWVRRRAFLEAVPWRRPGELLADRRGKSLASGGDIERGELIGRAGHERRYHPELRVEHVIPPGRCETGYFCRLVAGSVRSELTLRQKYGVRGRRDRWVWRAGRLAAAAAAVPWLLLRRDGWRECAFALAARWAEVRGPY